ncbi:MAG: prepilin-type N-terminal cleavage/methylation domain-containing protein [Planctomycetales bacterium]|nr:prepilin-type N-terminal cleavage/methylation domain-containing protein [Planctomycetales bacterium]
MVQSIVLRPALPRYRPSFTLVELLVAIAIMGVMVGMVLFSLAGAQTDAKINLTRKTIEKLNSVILQEWESFRYRAVRIDLDSAVLRPYRSAGITNGQPPLSPREGARLRMIVLRDTMRMEMPDRLTDILFPPSIYKVALFSANNPANPGDDLPYWVGSWNPATGTSSPNGSRVASPKLNSYRAALNESLRRLGAPVTAPPFPSPYIGPVAANPALDAIPPAVRDVLFENQPAEMLYQIVASSTYEGGSAIEAFRPSEIGDTDNDGLPEFLDAWGTPIRWIRWPSGFASPLNTPFNEASNSGNSDALDPIRTDWRWASNSFTQKPWLLVPLIISAGPDRVFDIAFDQSTPVAYASQTWSGTNSAAHTSGSPYYYPDPYVGSYDTNGNYVGLGLGSAVDTDDDLTTAGTSDNITNYSLILE